METLLTRVSGDFLSKLARARRAGLFEQSRSEFCRYVLAQHLKRMAAATILLVGFTLAADAHEPGTCTHFSDNIEGAGDALTMSHNLIVGAAERQDLEGLFQQFPMYMQQTNNLIGVLHEYVRCVEGLD